MRIVQIDYDEYIDLDDLEFVENEALWKYVEQIEQDEVIYGTKVA